jgi:hypothetical protein
MDWLDRNTARFIVLRLMARSSRGVTGVAGAVAVWSAARTFLVIPPSTIPASTTYCHGSSDAGAAFPRTGSNRYAGKEKADEEWLPGL